MQGKESTLRSLAGELSKFNVREYNLANIINAVVSRFKKPCASNEQRKTRGCYEDTIEWLWKLWKANVLKNEMPLTTIPLLNHENEVKILNELYFGQEFGNAITENLFDRSDALFCFNTKTNSLN